MIELKVPSVLAVMAPSRARALIRRIEEQGVGVISAAGRNEAQRILRTLHRLPIVVTDESLPDGDWRDVIEDVTTSGVRAEVVVCANSTQATRLCFELLDRGAFGMLAHPFDNDQLHWLINTATSRNRLCH